jgi:hypothetical protein
MGGPNTYLLPAAVLYENPGVTREEFADLLNQIHFSLEGYPYPEKPWEEYDLDEEDIGLHLGLYGLSSVLSIRDNIPGSSFWDCSQKEMNRLHQEIMNSERAPYDFYVIANRDKDNNWVSPSYRVYSLVEYKESQETKTGLVHKEELELLKKDKELKTEFKDSKKTIKKIILDIEVLGKGEIIEQRIGKKILKEGPFYNTKINYRTLTPEYIFRDFEIFEEFNKNYPQHHYDNLGDWDKESGKFGHFTLGKVLGEWVKTGKRYYLKNPLEKFNETLFSDLIITSEIIKKKSWCLFKYYGYDNAMRFLVEHPDVWKKREKAILDYYNYKYAKAQGMNNTEFLRFSLLNQRTIKDLSDEEALSIVCREAGRDHGFLLQRRVEEIHKREIERRKEFEKTIPDNIRIRDRQFWVNRMVLREKFIDEGYLLKEADDLAKEEIEKRGGNFGEKIKLENMF